MHKKNSPNSTKKPTIEQELFRVLKPGGELYFSDVYADRRVPEALRGDTVLWGECLSGALYEQDFHKAARDAGFKACWVVASDPVTVGSPEIEAKCKGIKFASATVRAFKFPANDEQVFHLINIHFFSFSFFVNFFS